MGIRKFFVGEKELRRLYEEKEMSLKTISKLHNVSSQTVLARCKDFGIIRRPRGDHNPSLRSVKMSITQKEIMIGAVLGDASLTWKAKAKNSSLVLAQGEKQNGYLIWKINQMQPLFPRFVDKGSKFHIDKRTGSKTFYCESIRTKEFTQWRDEFYGPDGRKKPTQKVLNEITPLGLAVLIMDDGYLHNKWELDVCTDSFTHKEVLRMVHHFKTSLGIKCNKIHKKNPNGNKVWRIRCQLASILPIIKKHMHPSMLYKIGVNPTFESSETNTPNTIK